MGEDGWMLHVEEEVELLELNEEEQVELHAPALAVEQ